MTAPEVSFVDRAGCKLAYSIAGEGVPVLFIQGVGVWGDGWKPQVDELAGRCRCITFDNRGMARSQPMSPKLTIEMMADDALAVMDAAGFESAHLVGHSMGGLMALQLALSAKQRVRSLSLLCTFASGAVPNRLSPEIVWIGTRTRIGTRAMRRNAFLELVMPPAMLARGDRAALAEDLAPLFGHDLAEHPPVVMQQLKAMKRCDLTPRLGEIDVPTLVVSGAYDRIAPPWAGRAIAQGIVGSRFVELPDAAHGVPIHTPELINPLLIEHISQAESKAFTSQNAP